MRHVSPHGESYWEDKPRCLITDVNPTSPSIDNVSAAYLQACEGHLVNGLLPSHKEVYVGRDEHGIHFYLVDHTRRRICFRGNELDIDCEWLILCLGWILD